MLTPGPISDQSWNGDALEFPRTIHITTLEASTTRDFALEEASYLAGMTTGIITRTGVIGMIGGTELPPVKRSFAAFALGARATHSSVRTIVSYIGNWHDVSAGKEQAMARRVRSGRSGRFTPRVTSFGLHDNIVRLTLNPRLEPTIPTRVQAQVASARISLSARTAKHPESK